MYYKFVVVDCGCSCGYSFYLEIAWIEATVLSIETLSMIT